jgi:hypothetical protein
MGHPSGSRPRDAFDWTSSKGPQKRTPSSCPPPEKAFQWTQLRPLSSRYLPGPFCESLQNIPNRRPLTSDTLQGTTGRDQSRVATGVPLQGPLQETPIGKPPDETSAATSEVDTCTGHHPDVLKGTPRRGRSPWAPSVDPYT